MEQLGPEGKRIEEADIEKHTKEGLTFFSNRICPFAHREYSPQALLLNCN